MSDFEGGFDGLRVCPRCRDRETTEQLCASCRRELIAHYDGQIGWRAAWERERVSPRTAAISEQPTRSAHAPDGLETLLDQPYAEDVNYWKTGSSAPDAWIDKAKAEIRAAGGKVLSEAFGNQDGRAAFLLEFTFGGDRFRAVWPVLVSKAKAERAARVQAATMLYHDVKAKCVSAKVHGARAAFFQYAVLPDGRTAANVAAPELLELYPKLLTGGD